MFILLTATQIILQIDNSTILHFHGKHSMVIPILLTATWKSTTIQREYTVVFPQQKWLCERATLLHYMYTAFLVFKTLTFASVISCGIEKTKKRHTNL